MTAAARAPTRKPADTDAGGASVFLVTGTDQALVSNQARQIIARILPEDQRSLGLEEITPKSEKAEDAVGALKECLLAVSTGSFFSSTKVVWLRDAQFLKNARVTANEAYQEWMDRLLTLIKSGLPAGHHLIITASSVDGRSALAKLIAARGMAVTHDVEERPWKIEEAARGLASQLFKQMGFQPEPGAVEAFADRVGTDTGFALQEAEKLAVYLKGQPRVPVRAVEDIVCSLRSADALTLADRMTERRTADAIRLLRRLLDQGEEPIGLLTMLESRWRQLVLLRDAAERGWLRLDYGGPNWNGTGPEAAAILDSLDPRWDPRKGHPFRVKIMLDQSRQFSARELALGLRDFARVREQLVSGGALPDVRLELLVTRLTQPVRRARKTETP